MKAPGTEKGNRRKTHGCVVLLLPSIWPPTTVLWPQKPVSTPCLSIFQWSHTLQCYSTVEGKETECPNILRGNFPRVTRGEDSVCKHWWATLNTLQDWTKGTKRLLNWMWADTRGLSCGWLNWTKPGRWEHGHYYNKSTCFDLYYKDEHYQE